MAVADAPAGLGDVGGGEHLAHAGAGGVDEQLLDRVVEPVDDLGLAAVEQRRQDAVGDDRRRRDAGLAVEPAEQVDRLGDRHLLGRRDDDEPGARRVLEDLGHPRRLLADHADLDELADDPRGGDLGDDVPAGLGVDDDEVVVPLAHLVGELADGEDLLDARRGVGDEVERPGERADAPDERHLDEQPQVLLERVLGVHRHREQAGVELARLERQRRGVERRGERALGVHLAHERALAGPGGQVGERGGDGRLADAALAGDEQQAAVEERPPSRGTGSRRRRQPPKPMRRSPSFVPSST